MADAQVLREFLVQLGIRVDQSSSSKFSSFINRSTIEITAFATAVEGAAALVVNRVAAMANSLEDLYFAAQRTGAAAENIRTFGFAADRLGSSVSAARSSLEAFRTFLGSTPAAGGLLRSFGVDPNQDPTKVLQQFFNSAKFQSLAEPWKRQYAELLHVDWRTVLALTDADFTKIQADADKTFQRLGINLKQATAESHAFNNQLAFLGNTFEALKIKVVEVLQQRLSVDIQRFRELVEANFDKIARVIDTVARVILTVASKVIETISDISDVFSKLYTWFTTLDPATKQFVEAIGLMILAWYGLDVIFKQSTIGKILLALTVAFELLYNDFKAWKAGAEHVIPWESWLPELQGAVTWVGNLIKKFDELSRSLTGQGGAVSALELFFGGLALRKAFSIIGGVAGRLAGAAGGAAAGAAGGAGAAGAGGAAGFGFLSTLGVTAGVGIPAVIGYLLGNWLKTKADQNPNSDFWNPKSGRWSPEGQAQRRRMLNGDHGFFPTAEGAKAPDWWNSFVGFVKDFSFSGTANWMRDSFDKLIENTGKAVDALEKLLIPSAEAATLGGAGMTSDEMQRYLPGNRPIIPTTTTAEVRARAAALMARLQRDLGITREGAAADVGNAAAESGIRSIPTGLAPQTPTSAFGIWQFTGSRRLARDAYARTHPGLSPEEVDIQFHEQELINKYPELLAKMRQTGRSFAGLAHDFFQDYEAGHAASLQQFEAGHTAYGQMFYSPALTPAASPQVAANSTRMSPTLTSLKVDSTINVHGVQDPHAVADRILQEYDRHNLDAVRNAQSAVR